MWHDSQGEQWRCGPPNQMHTKRVDTARNHTHTHTRSKIERERDTGCCPTFHLGKKKSEFARWILAICVVCLLCAQLALSISSILSLCSPVSCLAIWISRWDQWIITCNYFLINYLTALRTTPYCDNFSMESAIMAAIKLADVALRFWVE